MLSPTIDLPRCLSVQNHAAIIKILAEYKTGEIIRAIERKQGKDGEMGLMMSMGRSGWQLISTVPVSEIRTSQNLRSRDALNA